MNNITEHQISENSDNIRRNEDYHFEPIDNVHVKSSNMSRTNITHFIHRPIPVPNAQTNSLNESSNKPEIVSQTKRSSTMYIDSTVRSYPLSRSITSDQIKRNRLFYYPSVQDVLDALNQRSFDKESIV